MAAGLGRRPGLLRAMCRSGPQGGGERNKREGKRRSRSQQGLGEGGSNNEHLEAQESADEEGGRNAHSRCACPQSMLQIRSP